MPKKATIIEVFKMARNKHFRYPAWCTTQPRDVSYCDACPNQEDCNLQTCFQILQASKGFFYAYELLLANSHYPWFSHSEEEFAERRERNLEKLDQPSLLYAIATNGAMSAELALKYLTYRENHDFLETHKLDHLFNGLPQEDRNEILLRIEQQTGTGSKVFIKTLIGFSDVFTEARYFFSLGNKGVSVLFDGFTCVVHEYANEVFNQQLST